MPINWRDKRKIDDDAVVRNAGTGRQIKKIKGRKDKEELEGTVFV